MTESSEGVDDEVALTAKRVLRIQFERVLQQLTRDQLNALMYYDRDDESHDFVSIAMLMQDAYGMEELVGVDHEIVQWVYERVLQVLGRKMSEADYRLAKKKLYLPKHFIVPTTLAIK